MNLATIEPPKLPDSPAVRSLRYSHRNRAKIAAKRKTPEAKARRRVYQKEYYKTHKRSPMTEDQKEKKRLGNVKWRAENPDKVKAIHKRHRSTSEYKVINAARSRAWRSIPENAVKQKTWSKRWRTNNPTRLQALRMKRKAVIAMATVDPQSIEQFVARIRRKRRVRCYYCQCYVSGKLAHIDHIIALSRGGRHAVDNLCASCPACNLKKGAKPVSAVNLNPQQVLSL